MKAVILSGSSRPENNTLRVSKAIENILTKKGVDTTLIDFTNYDMPFFNGEEFHIDSLSSFQTQLVSAWDKANLVFVISPEYNWFPSAELVNMIHQIGNHSFSHLFDNKVFAFGGVSSGRGGRLPSMQMSTVFEKLIFHMNKYSICSPAKYESHYSPKELSEAGDFTLDSQYKKHMNHFVDYNMALTLKFQ